MACARLPILTLLYFFFFLFFFRCTIFTIAGNFPSTPYSPIDDIGHHKCCCSDNSVASPNTVYPPRTSTSWSQKPPNLLLSFGLGNAVVTGVIIIVTLLNIIVYKLRELQEANFDENNKPSSLSSEQLCRQFSLAEMQLATNNFDQALVIGKGGFGKVYKGLIDHGATSVAIKRLDSRSKQGASEFWTEIKMLSKIRHSHVVSLFGYCDDFNQMILVYEYVSGGNLEDHLYKISRSNGNSYLSWVQRLKICIGTARALDYLHTGTGVQHRVIHRDVKSSNILLDENLAAKISDLGVSKVGPANQPCTHVSTDVKGSFGYFDPDYFLTRRLTRKSDVYAFGVVLFEVLCGRPALDLSLEEDQRGLAGWAQHCIREGIVDHIIDPSLRGQILPNCLTKFVHIAEQCLQNRPKKRPTMAEVVVKLESVLTLQDSPNTYMEQEFISAGDGEDHDGPIDAITKSGDASCRQSHMRSVRTFSRMLRNFFSVKARVISVNCDAKPSRKKKSNSRSIHNSAVPNKELLLNEDGDVIQEVPLNGQTATPNLKVFTFAELKRATKNFSQDMLLGEGGFGKVFLGWVDKNTCSQSRVGVGMAVAVKKLSTNSVQGPKEWQTEVQILGQLSHSHVIRLLGYCREEKQRLLVYEYMQKGTLESFIFGKASAGPLPWATRIKVLIGAARGLAFLHTTEKQVIYRDFKCSNILLDQDFNAKLADFGMARSGPIGGDTYISTRVMGTYGYAAPEYLATGHLSVKCDIYAFGVVLLEILTGRRAVDLRRPAQEHMLVDWASAFLLNKRSLKKIMDPRLNDAYPLEGAFQCAALVRKCIQHEPRRRPAIQEVVQTLEKLMPSSHQDGPK